MKLHARMPCPAVVRRPRRLASCLQDSPVTHFNGHKVSNLAQLARLVLGCADEYLRFSLEAANKVGCGLPT